MQQSRVFEFQRSASLRCKLGNLVSRVGHLVALSWATRRRELGNLTSRYGHAAFVIRSCCFRNTVMPYSQYGHAANAVRSSLKCTYVLLRNNLNLNNMSG